MENNQLAAKDTVAIMSNGERGVNLHRRSAHRWSGVGYHQTKRITHLEVLIKSEERKVELAVSPICQPVCLLAN